MDETVELDGVVDGRRLVKNALCSKVLADSKLGSAGSAEKELIGYY